jgi:hypothetical protein
VVKGLALTMKILFRGLGAAACALALLAPPALADRATVRIEGDGVSLARTVDVPTSGTFGPDSCPYDSPGGAIEVATGGNWDRRAFTNQLLGETHAYAQLDYWQFWLNRTASNVGICDASQPLSDGDEVLMIVQRDDEPFPNSDATVSPLFITSAPGSVERGGDAVVTVTEHRFSYAGGTSPQPAAGVTVSSGDASATTDSGGRAVLRFGSAGSKEIRATAPQKARSNAVTITVTEPGQSAATPAAQAVVADRVAPFAAISSVREGRVFRRGAGPRVLRGAVRETGGVLMVKLRLTRNDRGRCSAWSAKRERFVRRRCGASRGWWFKVGERADWEYQLPARLPRGRYVLDVNAIDQAYNRDDTRRRGTNRVVFQVR